MKYRIERPGAQGPLHGKSERQRQDQERRRQEHPFVRFKRKARLTYLRILRIDDPPERIAGARHRVAMGVLPTFGLGIISPSRRFILRANKAASVLGSFIMNP
jgi:uncharacterized protein (DUF2062 family)